MIWTVLHGFCMALADSVPGVSGGTVALILGFYEQFLNALHSVLRGNRAERKTALCYLLKLGLGWSIGMISCVLLLSNVFTKNSYFMSSLFLGFTCCSLPMIVKEEKKVLQKSLRNIGFALVGVAIVVGLTMLRTNMGALESVNYTQWKTIQFIYLFFSGAIAITAMVLPGISGASILLIAGVYVPTIQAIHSFLNLQFQVVPGLCALGFGILAGIMASIHTIRTALRIYRPQMVWLILGLLFGSLYAIIYGPTTLDIPKVPLDSSTFQPSAFLFGTAILLALEYLKKVIKRKTEQSLTRAKGDGMV